MSQDLVSSPSQITSIPVSDLVIPPWNPRHHMDEGGLRNLTDFIRQGGLVPRIQAWKGEGATPFNVISGQRRLEAYRRAGIGRVEVEILDISLEEAKILATTSNEGEPLDWLDDFENMETLLADYPGWGGITALASKLGREMTSVNRAINLMRLLTPAARNMIRDYQGKGGQNLGGSKNLEDENESPKASWLFTEFVAVRLNGLLKGRTLPEAQALAEKAIPIILSRKMTAAQVDQWVKGNIEGQKLEAGSSGAGDDTKDERPSQQPEIATSQNEPIGSAPRNDSNGQNAGLKAGGFLGVLGGLLTGLFARRISNQGGLAGGIKTFLLQNLKRALGTMARRWMLHGLVAIGAILLFSPHLFVSLYHLASGSTDSPQVGNGDSKPKVTHLSPEGGSVTQAAQTASLVPGGSNAGPSDPAPVKPFTLDQGRLESDSTVALDFARDYYGADYSSTTSWIANLNSPLAPDYSQAFFHELCPPSWIETLRKRKLLEDFHTTGPVRVLGADPNGEDFLVEGNAVWKSDLHQWGKVLAKGPVALEVHVAHLPGDTSAGKIGWVKEITSLPVPGITSHGQTSPGAQKVNGINKGQNSYPVSTSVSNNAVHEEDGSAKSQGITTSADDTVKTIGDTVDTADKAKKLFGF